MWADLLTKPLTNKKKFADCRSIIMNCQPNEMVNTTVFEYWWSINTLIAQGGVW